MLLSVVGCKRTLYPKKKIDEKELSERIKGPNVKGVEESMFEQAKASDKAGSNRKSAAAYKQLSDKNPSNILYTIGLADSLRKNGEYKGSLVYYDKALELDSGNLDAMEGKGISLLELAEFKAAAEYFTKVMNTDESRWKSINGLGITLCMYDRINDALEYFKVALDKSDNHISVLNNIGLAFALSKDYASAAQSMEVAVSKLRDDSIEKKRVENNLAVVYGISGQMNRAESILRKYYQESEVYNNLGYYAKLAKNPELAKSYLNMALSSSSVYYKKAWENLDNVQGAKR